MSDFVNIGLALVFYMTALGFGMMIAQSVVQEKESRVVEILAAAVPIRALLWGKVIGNTVLALSQIVVIAAASLIGLLLTDQADILKVIAPVAGWFVVFFVLGFVALAGLWAVAGSLATRQEDLGSTTLPGQMILMIPFFFAVFAGCVGQDGRVVRADRFVDVDAGPDADRGRTGLAAAGGDRDPARHDRADRPPRRPAVRADAAADRSSAGLPRGDGAQGWVTYRPGSVSVTGFGVAVTKPQCGMPVCCARHLDYGLNA